MIIDHIGLGVSNVAASNEFYKKCLATLNIVVAMEYDGWIGFGRDGKPEFWLEQEQQPPGPMHIAFVAENRKQVDAFYQAAIAAGAKDNGAPGIRKEYHPDYYGAFVFDPDGHNIEAVCHHPE